MDRVTGALVTHTMFESPTDYTVSALGDRDAVESERYAAFYHDGPDGKKQYMSRVIAA